MVRNWLRFACFCTIFFLLFSWCNAALNQRSRQWREFYQLPRNSIDVVIIGNSHAFGTFQSRIINELIPVSTYAIGTPGESIFVSYYELKELLKYQKPHMVLLETFAINMTEPVDIGYIFQFTDAGHLNDNKWSVLKRYLPLDIRYSMIPVFRERMDWNAPSVFFDKMSAVVKPVDRSIGKKAVGWVDPEPLSDAEYDAVLQLPGITENLSLEENLEYLNRFVDLCEQNNIHLVLMTTPVIKISSQYFPYYTPFDVAAYAHTHQIDWITFDTSSFTNMHYANLDHVSIFGSIPVSVDLAEKITNILSIPMDQNRLNDFRQFYFSDFTLERDGEYYTLTLIPETPQAALLYKYVIMDADYREEYSTDWMTSSQYSFSDADEIVHMKVIIKNVEENYQFEAFFNNY